MYVYVPVHMRTTVSMYMYMYVCTYCVYEFDFKHFALLKIFYRKLLSMLINLLTPECSVLESCRYMYVCTCVMYKHVHVHVHVCVSDSISSACIDHTHLQHIMCIRMYMCTYMWELLLPYAAYMYVIISTCMFITHTQEIGLKCIYNYITLGNFKAAAQ